MKADEFSFSVPRPCRSCNVIVRCARALVRFAIHSEPKARGSSAKLGKLTKQDRTGRGRIVHFQNVGGFSACVVCVFQGGLPGGLEGWGSGGSGETARCQGDLRG